MMNNNNEIGFKRVRTKIKQKSCLRTKMKPALKLKLWTEKAYLRLNHIGNDNNNKWQ